MVILPARVKFNKMKFGFYLNFRKLVKDNFVDIYSKGLGF